MNDLLAYFHLMKGVGTPTSKAGIITFFLSFSFISSYFNDQGRVEKLTSIVWVNVEFGQEVQDRNINREPR